MADLLDKTDRAVRAAIFDAVKGVNAAMPIYIRNDSRTRDVTSGQGLVDVDSHPAVESPVGSGCYLVTVMVRAKAPAATQPNQGETDNHDNMAALINAVHNVLHQTNTSGQDYDATAGVINDAGNALAVDASNGVNPEMAAIALQNADMANFTCLDVIHNSLAGGKPPDDGLNFVELVTFQCRVCGRGGMR